MLRGEFESAGEQDADALRAAYDDVLVATIDAVGRETVADRSGVDAETLDALVAGESPDLSLTEAAAILATDEDRPDADTVAVEARDILLMGMTTAVLDVEALASEVNDALEPKEIQQKIEGRYPMTLDEYARLHSTIEARKR
ncbi:MULTISPECIES: DUF5791 family protein [Salinibaculum]|uniref:DUF5791 family protein n=1 Tax=Salinibaculum TaxID=2732368 RepID=UPI0030CCA6D4